MNKTSIKISWWLYLILAILSYYIFSYILPTFSTTGSNLDKLFEMAPEAAPIISIVFLLLAANGLYKDAPGQTTLKEKSSEEKKDLPPQ